MSGRLRLGLSRTLAPGRWREYRRLLEAARAEGYEVLALEDWVLEGTKAERVLVLRHDVDQHPRSALAMAAIERELGMSSTWYFRWRTAAPGVVADLTRGGASVGLHYETLSRLSRERGTAATAPARVAEARELLRTEIRVFERLHGPIRSICPHGDTRMPGAANALLLRGQDPATFGVAFDANEAMRGRGVARWLTDRSSPAGGWVDGLRPRELLGSGVSPLLCVVHPNNWVSGAGLWLDRLLGVLPAVQDGSGGLRGPLRTGVDTPPA